MENYKVVVIGTAGVGVTAITVQFVENHFVESYDPTIDDSFEKMMNFHDHDIKLNILDVIYDDEDESSTSKQTNLLNVDGFIVVFSVCDPTSFQILDKIISYIKCSLQKSNRPIIVCGNKIDMNEREVSTDEATEFCKEKGLLYFETSAKTNTDIERAFIELIEMMKVQNNKNKNNNNARDQNESCCIIN